MRKFSDLVIMFFCRLGWAGLSPRAPGTVGSLIALLLAPWLFLPFSPALQAALLGMIFVLGGLAASRAEIILGAKDPSQVVIDELLGQWTAVLPISLLLDSAGWAAFKTSGWAAGGLALAAQTWPWLLLAFALFRIFDIRKPWPVGASENWLPAGFGIMLDDLLAGGIAAALLYLGIIFTTWAGI